MWIEGFFLVWLLVLLGIYAVHRRAERAEGKVPEPIDGRPLPATDGSLRRPSGP